MYSKAALEAGDGSRAAANTTDQRVCGNTRGWLSEPTVSLILACPSREITGNAAFVTKQSGNEHSAMAGLAQPEIIRQDISGVNAVKAKLEDEEPWIGLT
jgi:hypothetical protein